MAVQIIADPRAQAWEKAGQQIGAGLGKGLLGLAGLTPESQLTKAGVDLTTPEGMYQAAQKFLQFGDYDRAVNFYEQGRLLEASRLTSAISAKEPADVREARIRAESVRNQMIRAGKKDPPSLEELQDRFLSLEVTPTGMVDYERQMFTEYGVQQPAAVSGGATVQERKIGNLTIPEYDAELDMLYKQMQGVSPQQEGVIRDRIQDIFKRKEILTSNLKDIDVYKKEAFASIDSNLETIDTIRSFISEVEKGNTKGWPQIKRYLTKLAGDSQIGQNEVDQTTRSGDILLRLKDWASETITGTPTAETLQDVKELIAAAESVQNRRAAKKIQEGRERFSMRNVPQSYIDQSLVYNRNKAAIDIGGAMPEASAFKVNEIYVDEFGNRAKYGGKDEQGNDIWETL